MLRSSGTIHLPREHLVRDLMSCSFQDNNLRDIFSGLNPERLVNILFDEVKLKSTLIFSSGHILGYAVNDPGVLAFSALAFEAVCLHGGPRFVLRVYQTAHLKAEQLKDVIFETIHLIRISGGQTLSIICDKCPLNQSAYSLLQGPVEVNTQSECNKVFLVYDYMHIFNNLRNNRSLRSKRN